MNHKKIGDKIPQVSFKARVEDSWKDINTEDIFRGKKVILFSLPGAFTPTCSSSHLPRFNELAPIFKENGIDEIYCLSVNDTFVMNAWMKDQEAGNLKLIPDGNGEFSDKMGMLVDKTNLGFGKRSWRYSMYVDDGVIKQIFSEAEVNGDPFEVSDADTMLEHLFPNARRPQSVAIFTKPGCPFCVNAKKLLAKENLNYEEIILGKDATIVSLRSITGKITAPQIFINGDYIGGYEDLKKRI